MKKNKKINLDSDEQELLSLFENKKLKSVKHLEKEKKQARAKAAKNLTKNV